VIGVSFQINKLLNIVLAITKTTEYGPVKKADIMLARLIIDSEKVAQSVDEFHKCLKVCAEAWGRRSEHLH